MRVPASGLIANALRSDSSRTGQRSLAAARASHTLSISGVSAAASSANASASSRLPAAANVADCETSILVNAARAFAWLGSSESTRRRHGIVAPIDGEATASQNHATGSFGVVLTSGCSSARALSNSFACAAAMPSSSRWFSGVAIF